MHVIFLHALPFGGEMWQREAEMCALPAFAPTLYDAGRDLAAWAHTAFAYVGDAPVGVVGCSIGGSVALEMARQRPNQVAGLMLVGAKAGVRPEPALRDEAVGLLETTGVAAAWEQFWAPLFARAASVDLVERWRDAALSRDASTLADGVRAFHDRDDLSPVAAEWAKPLMAVVGSVDRSPSPQVVRELADGPGRSFHEVANCGHYVNLEQPDAFDVLLDQFVSSITVAAR